MNEVTFQGREPDVFPDATSIERLDRFARYLRTERRRPIFITGATGAGKTTFVGYALDRFGSEHTRVEWIRLSPAVDNINPTLFRIREAKDRRRVLVVLENAEVIDSYLLESTLRRFLNLKVVENVIVVTANPDAVPKGAREIFIPPRRGKLYGLKDQLIQPQQSILFVVRPHVVMMNDVLIQRLKKEPSGLFEISPRQFEAVIADLLAGMGMDVELTPATRDGGKDILAYMETEIGKFLTLVEAKRHNKTRPVGVSLVRSLFGTLEDHKATTGMLVTTSRFAKPAKEFQERHKYQLSLKDYTDVVSWLDKHKPK